MNHRVASPAPGLDLDLLLAGGSVVGLGDAALLARVAAGPGPSAETAFAALIRRHGPLVARVCRGILGDAQLAEDAEQAVFLILARRARSIGDPDRLAPWLYGVALRTARAARRRRPHPVSTPIDEATMIDPTPDPARTLIRREQADLLLGAIARLPRRYLAPVVLCDLEGLTHAEAAAQLGCPTATVSSHLKRARDKLRSSLARHRLDFESALPPVVAAASLPRAFFGSTAAQLLADRVAPAALATQAKAAVVAALVAGIAAVASQGGQQDPPAARPAVVAGLALPAEFQDPPRPAPPTQIESPPPIVQTLPQPMAAAPAESPFPRVGLPTVRDVRDYELFGGRIAASRTAEVFHQEVGVITRVEVAEGDSVQAGQVLFKVMTLPNLLSQDVIKRDLARASRQLEKARSSVADSGDPALIQAQARVKTLQRQLDQLETDGPTAPFAGQVVQLPGKVGMSSKDGVALLAKVAVVDPVQVDIEVPERSYMKIQRWLRTQPGMTHLPARVALVDEEFAHQGRVLFRATQFAAAPNSGPACTLHAVLPNPDRTLIPGLTARVRVVYGATRRALLLPTGTFVAPDGGVEGWAVRTVDAHNIVGLRMVEADGTHDHDGFFEVISGIEPTTRIILRDPEKFKTGDVIGDEPQAPPK